MFFTWVEETALAMCAGAGIFAAFHVALEFGLTLSLLMAVATGAALFVPWMPRRAQPPAPARIEFSIRPRQAGRRDI